MLVKFVIRSNNTKVKKYIQPLPILKVTLCAGKGKNPINR